MRYPAADKLEIIHLVEQSHLPVRRTLENSAFRVPLFTTGMISIGQLARRLWKIVAHGQSGCGTASPTR